MGHIIKIEKYETDQLDSLGVSSWPVWEKEISTFPWSYDACETCYILEGEAKVKPENAEAVVFKAGDKVFFPKGLKCVWEVIKPIRKYYNFE